MRFTAHIGKAEMDAMTDAVWQALSHPVRRRIVDLLRDEPRTTGFLAEQIAASDRAGRFAVQRHLGVLRDSGLVGVTAHGRQRRNSLNGAALHRATIGWLRPTDADLADRLDRLRRSLEHPPRTITHDNTITHDKESTMDIQHLDITQTIDVEAPPDRVFAALVDDTASWWGAPYSIIDEPETIDIDARLGGLVRESRGKHEALWGVINEFEPGRVLAWTGAMGMGSGSNGTVTYTVSPNGSGARVTVHHVSIGPFPQAMSEGYGYGWDDLNHRLKAFVETGAEHGVRGTNAAVEGFEHSPG